MEMMSSQDEHKRIMQLGDVTVVKEAVRIFDWDGNFDYSRYPQEEIDRCRYGKDRYNFYISESQIWKDKRIIRIMIDWFRCRSCGGQKPDVTLSVDHCDLSYKLIPFESIIDDLTTLCIGEGSCHDAITNCSRRRRYDKQPIVVEPHAEKRIGLERHGRKYEKIELSPHRDIPHYFPQRTNGKPSE